jgi:transketolase
MAAPEGWTPNQDVFARTLMALAEQDDRITVVTSDSRGSGKLVPYGHAYPKQIVEVGIAEQNLVGVAAGLASCGRKVFAVSPACFLTARSLEQIKNDVAYSDNPVTLVGISAGVSYGPLGSTHHSLHDLAALRAIHNLTIVVPADNAETAAAVQAAAGCGYPVYLRFGKKPMPASLTGSPITGFAFGKGRIIREGYDGSIIANGETVLPALQAAEALAAEGISLTVVSLHTVKPLDTELIDRLSSHGRPMLTVEEHSVHGGLGEAVAGWLMQHRRYLPFRIMGLPDEYTVTGSQSEIFGHYGISREGISGAFRELLT